MRLHDGDLTVVDSGEAHLITIWLPLSDENQRFPNCSSPAIAPELSGSESSRHQRISPLLPEYRSTQSDILLNDHAITAANTQRIDDRVQSPLEMLRAGIAPSIGIEMSNPEDWRHRRAFESWKVLIVDDSPMVRKVINRLMCR